MADDSGLAGMREARDMREVEPQLREFLDVGAETMETGQSDPSNDHRLYARAILASLLGNAPALDLSSGGLSGAGSDADAVLRAFLRHRPPSANESEAVDTQG